MTATSIRGAVLAALFGGAIGVLACSKAEPEPDANRDRVKSGETLYASMCKSCHGARGEGGRGPAVRDLDKRWEEPALVRFVDEKMPLGEPDKCNGTCPEDVVAYMLATFKGPVVCDRPVPVARGLRLLTRREYRATVQDLLGVGGATSPSAPGTCNTKTFTFDPMGRTLSRVHVAGSFNGWAATIAAGGWPLAKKPDNTWALTRSVPDGSHQYKLVLDESEWILDPTNPKTAPNGLGGDNSVLDVSCGAGATGGGSTVSLDPTSGFPPDIRPEGFFFDDHGPGRIVTSVVMDEWARAASTLASAADVTKLVPCDRGDRDACAGTVVEQLGKRAFRRPLSPAEIGRYRTVLLGAGDFDKGVRAALRALLTSPSFAYRSEVGERRADGKWVLTPWETASALSYFFWGTMPDAALFDAAARGDLATPAGIEKEARRLLASPRARQTIATFAEQWLGIEPVRDVTKSDAYPLPKDVRDAMLEETRRLVEHVVFDGTHGIDELFTARYTFANEALAKHYGLPGVTGAEMRKVDVADPMRSGILGHGSVLATTAHSDQTSPIRRGLFVRRRLLCQEFPPPPPNAGGVPKVDPQATTRERFAQHTKDPFCKSCHQYIDGLGFGFERLDPIGRVRTNEAGKAIDGQGDLNDLEGFGTGTHAPFASMKELGDVLASSKSAEACLVRQMYRFARGQLDDDVCMVRPIEARFREKNGDIRELMIAIVTDPAFVERR